MTTPTQGRLALIGVGLMGTAMAERWLAAGFAVHGFDTNPERLAHLATLGGVPMADATSAASAAERVVLSLPDSGYVRAVVEAIAPALPPGAIVIDTTTGDPADAEAAAARLAAQGVAYLDAAVSGSSQQIRDRTAIVIAGGDPAAFAACREVFEAIARTSHRVGPAGSGSRMKLLTNLVLGLNRAALAEGLALATALGLDRQGVLDVLMDSAAYSRIMDAKGPKMVAGDYTPQARLSQHRKDVGLLRSLAESVGLELPLTDAHDRLLGLAEEAGFGASDNSAILEAYTRLRRSPG